MSYIKISYDPQYTHGKNQKIEMEFKQETNLTLDETIDIFNTFLKAAGYCGIEVDVKKDD